MIFDNIKYNLRIFKYFINAIIPIVIKLMTYNEKDLDIDEIEFKTRVFISSLQDAVKCTEQICQIKSQRHFLNYYMSRYLDVIKNRELLLGFKNYNSNSNKNLNEKSNKIEEENGNEKFDLMLYSGLNKDSIYVFLLLNKGFEFYSKNSTNLDKCSEFHELNKLLTKIEVGLKKDLYTYVNSIKM